MSGAATAAHAAQEKKKKEQEEEEMTRYTREELDDDWEFKIVRSTTGAFKKRAVVEQVKAEEAAAGWVMIEKFDDNRIRFKRPLSAQRNDAALPRGIDPYRTTYGMGEGTIALVILGVCAAVGGAIALMVTIFN